MCVLWPDNWNLFDVESPGMSVSPTLKPVRAFLTSGDGMEGQFESYSTPLPGILVCTRKGNVFRWVPTCGSDYLGRRPSPRGKDLHVSVIDVCSKTKFQPFIGRFSPVWWISLFGRVPPQVRIEA